MKTAILVPVDFSPVTSGVLQEARTFAKAFDAHIWLLHVASARLQSITYEIPVPYLRDDMAMQLRECHQLLNRHRQALQDEGLEVTSMLVQHDNPAGKIVQEARRLGARVILLGSHGHGRFHRMFAGSVSAGVLKHAPCPVVIVPGPAPKNRQATPEKTEMPVDATL